MRFPTQPKPQYDATIAVWNRFWSDHIAQGLMQAGYRVLMIGSVRRFPSGCAHITSWLSLALMCLTRYVAGPSQQKLIRHSRIALGHTARKYALTSPVFWAWSGFNLPGMQRAKANKRIVISEVGSTHIRWQRAILDAEYHRRGMSPSWNANADIERSCREWQVADYICVPSSFIADTYVQMGIPANKLALNPYGVDVDFWRREGTPAGGPEEARALTFVFAGHANLRKGIHYLVEAWRQAGLPNAQLLVVGGCDAYGARRLQSAPPNVRVLDRLTHAQMRDVYARCDVYVFPSLEEGMARSCLEAMAAGLPAILTRESGLDGILEEGADGWFVPAANAGALADRFQHAAALGRPALRRMGQSAQQRVRNLTWQAYGNRAAKFLGEILAGATPSNRYDPARKPSG